MLTNPFRRRTRDTRGQALVEFAIAAIPFLLLVLGIVDLGRAIYQMNTTAQASREIARATSLHPWATCCDLGTSTQAVDVANVQRRLLPGMTFDPSSDITCIDISESAVADDDCGSNEDVAYFVVVTVKSTFTPATPLTMLFGSHTFTSTSRVEIP
jgi:Flp pilus assembly protein TadG